MPVNTLPPSLAAVQTYGQTTHDGMDYLSEAVHGEAGGSLGPRVLLQGAVGVLVPGGGVFGGPTHGAPDEALQAFLHLIAGAGLIVRPSVKLRAVKRESKKKREESRNLNPNIIQFDHL